MTGAAAKAVAWRRAAVKMCACRAKSRQPGVAEPPRGRIRVRRRGRSDATGSAIASGHPAHRGAGGGRDCKSHGCDASISRIGPLYPPVSGS